MKRPALAAALALCAATAVAQSPGQRIAFVGCPILRNTQPVPCWLGEYKGELFYLGPQGDLQAGFYPPQFNHKVLVEGVVSTEPRKCGGVVLKEVTASVLPPITPSCNVILPAEGHRESEDLRGPGPSGHRGHPPEPPRPRPAAEKFAPPFAAREFTATFDADTSRLWRQAQAAVTRARDYAAASKASRVEITGHRAAVRLSDGTDYVERQGLAEERAKAVGEALVGVGLPPEIKVKIDWRERPVRSTGTVKDAEARRVVITVIP